jgi:CubicO group peptidase (beta-lactamase class C family)
MKYLNCAILLALCLIGEERNLAADKPLPAARPESLGVSAEVLAKIDEAVHEALRQRKMPGAVVVIVHRGKVVFRKAFGKRSLNPDTDMTPEVVFDLASLTKPMATALSIMILVEKGKLHLGDLVADYVPGTPFGGAKINIEQLLLHTSGLAPNNAALDYKTERAKALDIAYRQKPSVEPGTKFDYSSLGYIILGDLVERRSGMSLDAFSRQYIFEPLGMNETTFNPQGKLKERAAPTEKREGQTTGQVHDPRAFYMGGVAGHAGLFGTADDLAVVAQMMLQEGEFGGRRILAKETVRLMTTPRPVPGGGKAQWLRNYGWDVFTSYSTNRGQIFPSGKSYGHTGFTGTSLWIDPTTQTAGILLSNKVYPDGKGDVRQIRSQVATLAAQALPGTAKEP